MKIVRFAVEDMVRYGALGEGVIHSLLGRPWEGLDLAGPEFARADCRLLAPVAPPEVWAIGFNYRAHAEELEVALPSAPAVFLKATSSVIGPGEEIRLPLMAPEEVDFEAELVIVIGRPCHRVAAAEALEYVLGYTCGNDVSARDCQLELDSQWARGKSFDTFCALGPWIETDLEPEALGVRSVLNGEVMQDGNTRDLIFSCRELVSYVSQIATLRPGTVIMTGTPPGVGYKRTPPVFLREGDAIEVEVEGIGKLTNSVGREKWGAR